MSKSTFKKWVRKYSAYLILAGIILGSFLSGLLVGALAFHSKAVSVPEETLSALPAETSAPAISDTVQIPSSYTPAAIPVKVDTEATLVLIEPEIPYYDVPLSKELQEYIWLLSQEYEVPCELIYALIETESSFRPNVVSGTNDYGLMQINKINHEWLSDELGISDFLDPEQNILAGCYILSRHLKATDGDIVLALMRYNCGAAGARNLWSQGIYSTRYTDKVMAAYDRYCEMGK